jgi:neutral ceramidase
MAVRVVGVTVGAVEAEVDAGDDPARVDARGVDSRIDNGDDWQNSSFKQGWTAVGACSYALCCAIAHVSVRTKMLCKLLLITCMAWTGHTQEFQFGAAERDITPPPGYPTGGHGPAGELARGYWNPLRTRAFYVRDGRTGVVLVSSDLFAFPIGLHAAVWKRVRKTAEGLGLGEQNLVLAATHTHQGPGNYLSAEAYNQFGSAFDGFSKELFGFLAQQIGDAIEEALSHPAPARLRLLDREITPQFQEQFVINRSPAVFLLNWDRDRTLAKLNGDGGRSAEACRDFLKAHDPRTDGPELPPDGWDLEDCPRLRAVDRRMTVLEALPAGGGAPLGVLVFFAVHPTGLLHNAPLYNSDFVGAAMDQLEARWPGAKVGFFNGGEGDIVPLRKHRDIVEVRRMSARFAAEVVETTAHGRARNLQGSISVSGSLGDTHGEASRKCGVEIAKAPAFGAAALGGGEGDRTILYELGWKEGMRNRAVDGQGPKLKGLDSRLLRVIQLTQAFAPPRKLPRYLPVVRVTIGELTLGALPVEVSTTAALRIREKFEAGGRQYFQLIGLANEYSSYMATASEYAAQDYMGASTIWGPREAEYFQCRLEQGGNGYTVPADAMAPGPPPYKPNLGALVLAQFHIATEHFGPSFAGERRSGADEELERILVDGRGLPARHLPYFEWTETVGNGVEEFAASAARSVEILNDRGTAEAGGDVLKILRQAPDAAHPKDRRWAAIWLGPLDRQRSGKYQFRVCASGKQVMSVLFEVKMESSDEPAAVAAMPGSSTCAPRQ